MKKNILHIFRPEQYSFKAKLVIGFLFLILLFVGAGIYNLSNVEKIQDQITLQNHESDKHHLSLDLKQKIDDFNNHMSGFMITKDLAEKEAYETKRKEVDTIISKIGDTASSPEQRKLRAQLITTSQEYMNVYLQAEEIIKDTSQRPEDVTVGMERLFKSSQVYKNFVFEKIDKLIAIYSTSAVSAASHSTDMLKKTSNLSLITPIVILIFAIILAFLLIRSFTKPIQRLLRSVTLIANGDLRHKINSTSRDELGILSNNFDLMIDQVREMLRNTQQIASSLSDHSHSFHQFANHTALSNKDIIKAIEEISSGADQQAVHSEQSANIIGVLDSELADIWHQTENIQTRSKEAERITLLGSESVEELNQSAQKTAQMIEQVAQGMHALTTSSNQIGKIVNTITEISTQTNVLSLNAAIEAARAGVHGKGFAVIAEEVRLLSQQTNQSSKTIGQLIDTILNQMQAVEHQMNGARDGFRLQNTKVDATLTSFHSIRESMQEMILQMSDIHQKIDQAKTKNHKLVESIEFVATVAEETAAGVQEVNSTSIQQDASIHRIAGEADDIHLLSQKLFAEINKFKTDDISFHIDEFEQVSEILEEHSDPSSFEQLERDEPIPITIVTDRGLNKWMQN
ncbi:MAG: methyl-accepting chemotaxis protein [Paenibacillaceae bacterium]